MSLTTPYLINIPIKAFDGESVHAFRFNVVGGSQVVKNELEIQNNNTSTQVYTGQDVTFQLEHIVDSSNLINGEQYKARVRTYDINDNASEWSRWESFYCFSNPMVSITNISNDRVDSTNYEFIGEYNQLEGEELESYQFFLYDLNENLISASPQQYSDDIRHSFAGLKDDGQYRIEVVVNTLHGMVASSGRIYFRVNYITPLVGASIILENIFQEGQVKITSNIIDIVGKSCIESIDYIDNEMVDLRHPRSCVEFDEGFSIKNDFTLKLWCKGLKNDNSVFLELYGDNLSHKIQLRYHLHKIHLYKTIGKQQYYLHSQELRSSTDDLFYIWIKNKNNLLDLRCSLMQEGVV